MILVIGGRNQGKGEFVRNNFKGADVLNGFHILVRKELENGNDTDRLIENALKMDVVISDEIGGGIVPVDRFERDWREKTGRALCVLASKAEAVYRVHAGIAVKIK
ncbi:MAG: bifunctional adenosylcobinamide kinase/adenosylcobinamide-phosphate guanylyltransferase [Clostridia bacterium]|nr:bifunctional adenosylcobinamide kinase/adenosylcobinamide-phosphate guanylyltransferase [Clostridia bacterium]